MGYLYGGKCYNTKTDAQDAAYSAYPVTVWQDATYVYQRYFEPQPTSPSGWQRRTDKYVIESGTYVGAVSNNAMNLGLPECDYTAPFIDGMTMGWGVVTAMVVVACLVMMRRAAR